MAFDPKAMNTKQKVTIGVVIVICIFLIWQVKAMFSSDSEAEMTAPTAAANGKMPGSSGSAATKGAPAPQQSAGPQPGQLMTGSLSREQQMELIRLQQETQTRYIAGLNELQLLKLAKDIAQANTDIAVAKLAMINSQKEIIEKLTPKTATPESQIPYGQGLVNPRAVTNAAVENAGGTLANVQALDQGPPGQSSTVSSYLVISVTELMSKWSAVLGVQGKLYNVSTGDTLPADGSVVKSIDRSGVILEKNGVTRKISLVPII